MSRSGHKRKLGFEGGQIPLLRRLPKRGFKNPTRISYTPVNLMNLAKFDDGSTVGMEDLIRKGLARGRGVRVKVLGTGGSLDRKLHVKVHAFSASAKLAIETAGGSCEVIT
jgi:large subunit ribosomal protein L15